MSEEDHFADVRGQVQGNLGIMEGPGAASHYSADEMLRDDGVGYQVSCDNCGQRHFVTVTWQEFVYGNNRLVPPGWAFSQAHGAFHPNKGCKTCTSMLPLFIRPDECSRHIKAGIMANKIQEAEVVQANQQLRNQIRQHRR